MFQGSHIPDVSTDFYTESRGSRDSPVANPSLGQPIVVVMVLANRLLQAVVFCCWVACLLLILLLVSLV